LYPIRDKPLHNASRRKAGAGVLDALQVGGGCLQLPLQVPDPQPLMIERGGENGGEDDRGDHGKDQCHEWPITTAFIRQSPLDSAVTPMTSIS
jgi:hypothetical protein